MAMLNSRVTQLYGGKFKEETRAPQGSLSRPLQDPPPIHECEGLHSRPSARADTTRTRAQCLACELGECCGTVVTCSRAPSSVRYGYPIQVHSVVRTQE